MRIVGGNAITVPGESSTQDDAITYNYLNLPDQIVVAGQGTIAYLYDAAGNKLKKTAGGTSYYQGSVLKINGQDIILTGEGRAIKLSNPDNSSTWEYQYNLKDHLGNTRVSFKADTARAEPLQYKDYYPFGMEMAQWPFEADPSATKYLYNGKELQDEYGLDWYDYGARFYDPELGRWHVNDPLAEEYQSYSPYNYTLNNPILFIDPDGRATTYNWGTERYEDEDGNEKSWDQVQNEYSIGNSNESKGSGLMDAITSFFDSFISQFSVSDNKGELYEQYAKGDESAAKEVEKRDAMNSIANTEITPYLSISLGKETADGSLLSGFGGLTFTPKSIYLTVGGDVTLSAPAFYTGTSVSVTAGIFTGSPKGIPGLGYGYGSGSVIGLSTGNSLSYNKNKRYIPVSSGTTKSYGLTFTTTPAWGSVNAGYTWDLFKK